MFRPNRIITTALASLLFASLPAAAGTINIDFEHFPGADGILGTADDVAAPNEYINPLNTQFASLGLNFSQGTLFQAPFYDGNPNNHFLSSTSPVATFSVPVFGLSIQSKSYWDATLTAFDSHGNVIASNVLLNPNAGSDFYLGTLALSSTQQIYGFSVLPSNPNYILNLDNLVITTSPVPEPEQYAMLAAGLALLASRVKRRAN